MGESSAFATCAQVLISIRGFQTMSISEVYGEFSKLNALDMIPY
jgi:hypothetical protein